MGAVEMLTSRTNNTETRTKLSNFQTCMARMQAERRVGTWGYE